MQTWFVCPGEVFVPATAEATGRCNVAITAPDLGGGPANGMTIAVDPTDPRRILAGGDAYTSVDPRCAEYGWLSAFWSTDGGLTWDHAPLPGQGAAAFDADNPFSGHACARHPVAFWDASGTAYYAGRAFTDVVAGSELAVGRSEDGGASFEQFGRVIGSGQNAGLFGMVADPTTGHLYAAWHLIAGLVTDQVAFAKSTDGGATWSVPVVLSERPKVGNSYRYPMVDADGHGNVYVAWRDGHGSQGAVEDPQARPNGLWLATSTDGGSTWSPAQEVVAGGGRIEDGCVGLSCSVESRAVLAVDRSAESTAGRVYLAWQEFIETGNPLLNRDEKGADIFLAWSDDRGKTWTTPLQVNDEATPADQSPPWLDVGPRGDVHVVFYDLRDHPDDLYFSVYYAHVQAGRVAPNLRVSEHPIVFSQTATPGIRWIGVDEGSDGRVHVIWTDTRFERADAFTATLALQADARRIGEDEPLQGTFVHSRASAPAGLAEAVRHRFEGHVDLPYYCFNQVAQAEPIARSSAARSFTFDVPTGTRFLNGTLDWATPGPTPDTTDLDAEFYEPDGDFFDSQGGTYPERFEFELASDTPGQWTAWVLNCQNPPTDFVLEFTLE